MNLFKKHLWLFATALLATSALMSASTIQAQTPREDFKRDITLSASNLSLIHISEPTRLTVRSRMPSSA